MTPLTLPIGRPGPSVQEVLARDVIAAPEVMRSESPASGLGLEDVGIERYYSKAWHDREVEKVWRKTWATGLPHRGDSRRRRPGRL